MMFRRVGSEPIIQDPEEKKWELKALGKASIHDYEEEDEIGDEELDFIFRLFGLYIDRKIPRFGKVFKPATHSEYESKG